MINLQILAPHATVVGIGGRALLFSYSTLVGVFIPGQGYYVTEHNYSATTSKHIAAWVKSGGARCTKVTTVELEALAERGEVR